MSSSAAAVVAQLRTNVPSQSLPAVRPKIGDSFSTSEALRIAAERAMLADGRGLIADGRVNGGRGKTYRCSGAIIEKGSKTTGGCQAHVKANKRADKHLYVTSACFDHQTCTGGKKNPSVKALAAEGAVVVNANRKVTAPALVKTLKGAHGVEVKTWSACRLKRAIIGGSRAEQTEDIQRLASFMNKIADASPGTITNCRVGGGRTWCYFCVDGLALSRWATLLSGARV